MRDFYSSIGLDGLPDHVSMSSELTSPTSADRSQQRHMNELGHQALGDMLTLYLDEQICETQRRRLQPPPRARTHWPKEDILGVIPRLYCEARSIRPMLQR